ncbi:maleylpyruvate isomerase family mycothiol-dependent enzyme [Streptomyces luteoverticillatus]|uniref:Maleylpyruvate isomerase family mycothiol-dependent enzyme n=1 Tax=Streptomyces luteoverticillatus TaxID=66425 RepID=A0A3Q9FVF9_STRLT|nr:maleylpyruvate isomerase family mycothiol-dependent enzyme [Streptomyces luteoverticillatus]AZQ71077.1 maleylpyruvate isomerase family mycothiol-dependent enzyme [Streptomyces luteoverticillatus]
MTDHVHDLNAVREATDRLLTAAGTLDNAAVAQASRLPGWTRGHVLAHLARNADALVNVLEGRPMYASAEARDADIDNGAPRELTAQLDDLRSAAARFLDTAHTPADWNRTVTLRNGVTDAAANIPFRRLIEVELHHVDLGIGYELEDLPAGFTTREIAFLADRFSGNADVPALRLVSTDGGTWTSGRAEGEPLTVTGTAPALLGWLAGRRDGAQLETGGAPLPVLPAL